MDQAILITHIDPNDPTNPISLLLDTVNDMSITASSTITSHPTVAGTPISDHMYKQPVNVSISGTFSTNGKQGIVIDKAGRSLARVEEMFENIKDQGILCTILRIQVTTNENDATTVNTPLFMQRDNMALQNISWTEHANSLSFSFSFTEVIQSIVTEQHVDPDDAFAPDIEYAEASSFTETMLDDSAIDAKVLQALQDYDLIDQAFLEFLAVGLGANSVISVVVGTAVALALAKTLMILGVASAIPVVGAVVTAVVAITLFAFSLAKLIKKHGYKTKAFKYYNNEKKNVKEAKRFATFYEDVHAKITELDTAIKLWKIAENKAQEVLVNIDGAYYIFNFTRNNTDTSCPYSANISDINSRSLCNFNLNKCRTTFNDCTTDNALFTTANSTVYMLRSASSDAKDLTSYFIVASQINPVDFDDALMKIIQNAIKY